jgi:OOP family OmpA-OmpF porin
MCAMKKLSLLAIFILPLLFVPEKSSAQVNNVGTVVTTSTDQHANNDINSTVNNGLNNAENSIKGLFKKKKKPTAADSAKKTLHPGATASTTGTVAGATSTTAAPSFSTYQNYDFVPGEQIIFEDEFAMTRTASFRPIGSC